jgi:hypothetical protein
MVLRVVRVILELPRFRTFRFGYTPCSLPSNGNATTDMINVFQSLVLVLLDSETCDQYHRNKTARKQPAAIDLLKKKIVSTTTPFLPRKKVHKEMSGLY